jgi:hypothetical protein
MSDIDGNAARVAGASGRASNQTLNSKHVSTNERCLTMPNISAFKEIYDWFYRTYGETSREKLLELMKNAIGIQHLKQLSQPDLAEFYCEGLAYSAMGPDRIL